MNLSNVTTRVQQQDTVDTDSAAVRIEHLNYSYPVDDVPVLHDISLTIQPGEFVLLIGPSGCGKSTLSLSLNGIIPHSLGGTLEGTIEVFGMDPSEHDIHEMATRVGLVLQDPESQICNIFVRDEVAFGPQNLLVPKDEIISRINEVLTAVDLRGMEDQPVFNLSGGQKQRVAIASVLAMQPHIMVFDEPTANLDPQGTIEVHNIIRQLNREHGVTAIVIEHDISHFVEVADRILVMENGKVAFDGHPREVLAQHGRYLQETLGLWIPGACEFALATQEKGYSFDQFPLTIDAIDVAELQFTHDNSTTIPATPSSPDQLPIISMRNVSFAYEDDNDVLHDISLDIEANSIVALAGQNGSGKSTLTSLLIGINRPNRGTIQVGDMDATKASIHDLSRKIGYVFQYPEHQFVADTVYDEVAFSLQHGDLDSDEVEQRVRKMLTTFQLEQFTDRHPFTLSKGQKRRLSVASMLVLRPDVFILDEPTTGQDWRNVVRLMETLEALHAEGLTIILVTHSMELVAQYAERVLVMKDGRIKFDDTPASLFSQPHLVEQEYHLEVPPVHRLLNRIRKCDGTSPAAGSLQALAALLEER